MNALADAQVTYKILDENTVAIGIELSEHPHLRDESLVKSNMMAFASLYSPRIHVFDVLYTPSDQLIIVVTGEINNVVVQHASQA